MDQALVLAALLCSSPSMSLGGCNFRLIVSWKTTLFCKLRCGGKLSVGGAELFQEDVEFLDVKTTPLYGAK